MEIFTQLALAVAEVGQATKDFLEVTVEAVVEVTGLRNPCTQLDGLQSGLMAACLGRAADGSPIRKAGVMGVVLAGGEGRAQDPIEVILSDGPLEALKPI